MTPTQTARRVLYGCLQSEGAELGAHDAIRSSQDAAESLSTLHAEYTTIARAAQEDRWEALLERSGLSAVQLAEVRESEAHGPLLAAFRDAEARGVDIESDFPTLVALRSLVDAEDIASVLHGRVEGWTKVAGSKRTVTTNLIAGLIPRAMGVMDPDIAKALVERDQAIEDRAQTLAERAVERNAGWVRRLGRLPTDPTMRAAWMSQVRVVAAYRDRWGIAGQIVIGKESDVSTIEQIGHHKRARLAQQKAQAISKLGREQRPDQRARLAQRRRLVRETSKPDQRLGTPEAARPQGGPSLYCAPVLPSSGVPCLGAFPACLPHPTNRKGKD